MPSRHNFSRQSLQARPRVNSRRHELSFVPLRQSSARRTKAATFLKLKGADGPRARIEPEGVFGEALLRTIQAGPHDALAASIKHDPIVRLAKAMTHLVWTLFHSADLDHHAAEAFDDLLFIEAELEHEVSTYGQFARTDEFRRKALDDARQLLHAFSEKLENHREELERGTFISGELR